MMKWTGWRMVVLATATAATACGSGDGDGTWAGTVTDSAGIPVVENGVEGLWAEGEAWQLQEVFRVGGMDADTAYQFGSVTGIDVTGDGRVLVADQQARTVRVFDPDGVLVARIGTPGQGPGELGPGLVGVYENDGQVIIPDIAQGRLQQFGLDGDFVRSLPFNPLDGIPIRWDEDGDGRIVVQRRGIRLEDGAPIIGETGDILVALDEGGANQDTLLTLPVGSSFSASGGNTDIVIFNPEPTWDLSESGQMVLAVNNRFRVRMLEPGGAPARILTMPREPVPVTEAEERRILAATRRLMQEAGTPPQAVDVTMEMMTFGESYPVLSQVLQASDGSVWVQRIHTARNVPEGVTFDVQDLGSRDWDIFDSEGRYLGVLSLPRRFQPVREIDGVLWGVARDELDVQSVVGIRVVKDGT